MRSHRLYSDWPSLVEFATWDDYDYVVRVSGSMPNYTGEPIAENGLLRVKKQKPDFSNEKYWRPV